MTGLVGKGRQFRGRRSSSAGSRKRERRVPEWEEEQSRTEHSSGAKASRTVHSRSTYIAHGPSARRRNMFLPAVCDASDPNAHRSALAQPHLNELLFANAPLPAAGVHPLELLPRPGNAVLAHPSQRGADL